ncbi:MAG: cyclic nucleotide-binding protein [Hydrogenophilales bacterium 28-61-23]|nr:MAG: cyclic nucleotide-binding protein [Hydrogenophilales bacterium 28-61-23]
MPPSIFSRTYARLGETRRNSLDWLLQAALTAWRLFTKNELQNHAAATAFYFLLSAAPLVLLLTYAAQYLAVLAESSVPAVFLLAALYEQFNLDELSSLGVIPQKAQISAGGVGLLTLVLSSRGLVNAVQSAFRVIFPDEAKRPFVLNWMLPLVIIPLVFGLVVVAVAAQASLTFFASIELLGAGRSVVLKVINVALALLAVWGLFYTALRRLPLRRPPVRPTLAVSALATLTWTALFLGFGVFFQVEKYQAVYGALGGVVFILIGAYFACLAFYFWAQFLYSLTKVDVTALEKLFLGGGGGGANKLESIVFGRSNRLLAKYGRHYVAGATLIEEGDNSREAFFLYAGKVAVYKRYGAEASAGGEKRLMEIEEGNLLGEMAYLLNEPRTASVRAETDVTALVLPPEMLEELMRYSAPLSRRIIGALAQRLMRMNQATQG